jgi:hypothetical protein
VYKELKSLYRGKTDAKKLEQGQSSSNGPKTVEEIEQVMVSENDKKIIFERISSNWRPIVHPKKYHKKLIVHL